MKELPIACCAKIVGLVIVYHLFLANTLLNALPFPFQVLNDGGLPIEISAEMEKNPDVFVDLMKAEFARGNLNSAGSFAKALINVLPNLLDARAIYSIYLASKGEIEEAKQQLFILQKMQQTTLFTLSAEAMIQERESNYENAISKCEKAILEDSTHPYPRNILGRIYIELQNYDEALKSFKNAFELKPDFIPGYLHLGAISFTTGNNDDSISYFHKAIRLNPNIFSAHYGIALAFEAEGRNKEAISALKKSIELKKDDENALTAIGRLQLKEELYDDALKTGKEMERANIKGAFEILGNASLQTGDLVGAASYLKKAPSDNLEAQYLLGCCYMADGRYDLAIKQMKTVLKKNNLHFGAYSTEAVLLFYLGEPIDPKDDLTNHWNKSFGKFLSFISGCISASNNNWSGAFKDFQASEGIISGFSLAGINESTLAQGVNKAECKYLSLGFLYYFKRLYKNAMIEFEKAIEINPDSIFGNYWVAQIYLDEGDRVRASQFFKNATSKASNFFAALYAIGELNLLMRKPEQAVVYYKRALSVKKDLGILIKLGLYYEQSGKIEEAEKYYRESIDFFPKNFIGYNQLAWLYAKEGIKLNEAMDLARKADRLQPGNASILDTIGWIYYQNKKYDMAIHHLEKAKGVNPNNPTILYHLGVSYFKTGKKELANSNLARALELSDMFEDAKKAQNILDLTTN